MALCLKLSFSLVVLANKTAAGFISFYSHLSQSIITTFACLSLQGSNFKKDLTCRITFCGWLAAVPEDAVCLGPAGQEAENPAPNGGHQSKICKPEYKLMGNYGEC